MLKKFYLYIGVRPIGASFMHLYTDVNWIDNTI